jgi:hypothetical protein
MRTLQKVLLGNLNGRYHLQDLGIDGRTILKVNLREIDKSI